MIQITLGGRLLRGEDHTKPSGLKSGYRGVRAGSREAGTASFQLLFRKPFQATDLWFEEGAEVEISVNGSTAFVGVVTEIDRPRRFGYVVGIECAESAGRVVEVRTGMPYFGNLRNPLGYCWVTDPEVFSAGTDDDGNAQTVRAKIVRAGDYFATDSAAGARGYAKQEIFDTYGYQSRSGNTGESARRMMLMYEQPLEYLVRRVVEANGLDSSAPRLTGRDVDLGSSKGTPRVSVSVKDEEGKALLPDYDGALGSYRPFGFFTRNLQSQIARQSNLATIYWRTVAASDADGEYEAIELYQLINHGTARKLGRVPTKRTSTVSPYLYKVHRFLGVDRYGPFAVLDSFGNLIDNPRIAWYWMWGYVDYNSEEDKTYYRRRAVVYDVDLTQILDESGETVKYSRYELESYGLSPGDTPDWVLVNNGNYSLINSRQPTFNWLSERTGGRYACGGDAVGPVTWQGDLYLSEVACDFEGSTLADVLHNLGLATGSEWWVDADGKVVFRKSDRTVADTILRAKQVFDDRETLRLPQRTEVDEIDGIPLTDFYQAKLKEQNKKTMISSANRRTLELIPDSYSLPLGSRIIVDGDVCGKLVAKEYNDPIVTLDCEPV